METNPVVYIADNGWEVTIFNDANTWDYINKIKIGEKESIEFDELDEMLNLRLYEPPIDIIRDVYKISE